MSVETTPSSQFADWEVPITESDQAMWRMRTPTAEKLLTETGPTLAFSGREPLLGKSFEALQTVTIDGHPVSWLKVTDLKSSKAIVTNGGDPLFAGTALRCPCDTTFRLVNSSLGAEAFRVWKSGCEAKRKAVIARQICESLALGYDARKQFKPKFSLESAHSRDDIKTDILDLVNLAAHKSQWIGNLVAGSVYPPTIQSILGMARGDIGDPETAKARKAARWSYFHELVSEGRLEHDGNWALKLPGRNIRK